MANYSLNFTIFEKKTFVIAVTLSMIGTMCYTINQLVQIDIDLLKKGDRSEMHLINFTSIISFFLWCIAFGLNKDLMLSNINNN
tara:strand:- start:18501 stop:18752 length:252 start_codon:yes stop_codon:yes gene_type:complete